MGTIGGSRALRRGAVSRHVLFSLFFFQAEDGIRDLIVTGVQTCALPILDERLRFVARLLEGEKMAPLCAAFGISRKTGYKIFERYKDCGIAAFTDRSRRPYRDRKSVV